MIDNPKRVEIIIQTAKIVNFPVTELSALVLDALDAERDTSLFPIYNVLPDAENFDPRAFMIFFLHNMIGSDDRSEEHTSELQSLMRISYAVFCLKKKKTKNNRNTSDQK